MQYGWADCPQPIRAQIEGFTQNITQILGDNLTGVYLHGSLAMGCFNPARSDIDLLVITQKTMTPEARRATAYGVLAASGHPNPIEVSFVRLSCLHPWQYPTPFDFHFSEEWREKTTLELSNGDWQSWDSTELLKDADLAAHVTITRARGIVLVGRCGLGADLQ